jgi:hypothetical protein
MTSDGYDRGVTRSVYSAAATNRYASVTAALLTGRCRRRGREMFESGSVVRTAAGTE